jgi:tRNA U34 2-thiouridine synthase MnmA/TrmU
MKIKAIALVSGGLDSTLATKVVMDQGVDVVAANFVSPFCRCDKGRSHARPGDGGCRHEAKFVSEQLGIPLKIVNVTKDFLEVLKSPKHGYGSNINPCIDCRILMLKKARQMMDELGAKFLITGEVLGQRPMSQRRDAMHIIEREAGVKGLVLRPLSARLLEPTIAETEGWVDRQKLLNISGRGRKPQMKLAEDYNIKDYPCPAGGCLLTDPAFSRRIRDLIDHDELTMEDIQLLNHGRYFRLTDRAKLIVGKNQHENERLEVLASAGDYLFFPAHDAAGASGLGRGDFSHGDVVRLAAGITARYFDAAKGSGEVAVSIRRGPEVQMMTVAPLPDEETKRYLI